MKINRSKGNLQSELQKMLQAGRENVENDVQQKAEKPSVETLHANEQTRNGQDSTPNEVKNDAAKAQQPAKETAKTKQAPARQNNIPNPNQQQEVAPQPRLNAAQRHEVPDRNAKYAGEPIKSVGCRMPQSLYARMLQYKAVNDTQAHRITLNDIIIEAVEKFMDEN